ncbi:MAG: HNH endonuclease signature motif containing protein [Candidatus Methanomethylophilaceae archaeon]
MYDGYAWYRYPDSDKRDQRVYYRNSTNPNGEKFLHRYIWVKYNGPIPEGYLIHHIDGNPLNNDISNLACVSPTEHAQEHPWTDERRAERGDSMRGDSWIQDKCREWHASEEGHQWHVEHGKQVAENMQPKDYVCEYCGKQFSCKPFGANKYCSNACKSAARRASGVDDVELVCKCCGKTFVRNKYCKSECCSRSCANSYRSYKKHNCN